MVWGRIIVPANTCCPGESRVWGAHQDHSAEAEVLADLRPDSGGEVRSANQYEIAWQLACATAVVHGSMMMKLNSVTDIIILHFRV